MLAKAGAAKDAATAAAMPAAATARADPRRIGTLTKELLARRGVWLTPISPARARRVTRPHYTGALSGRHWQTIPLLGTVRLNR